MPRAHVIGAGLAGLATAVNLARRGAEVVLHEASRHAGGRCRSFHDAKLGRDIDNGNHLILSGNHALAGYIDAIHAHDHFREVQPARFDFIDFADATTGDSWRLAPGSRPWWIFLPGGLPPGVSTLGAMGDMLRLARARSGDRVGDRLDVSGLRFRRLWAPLAVAALNTEAAEGSARLLWAVVRETLLRGEAASRPRLAIDGLTPAFVDPALAWLRARGAGVRLGCRLRELGIDGDRIVALGFGTDEIGLDGDDRVVLAVPRPAAGKLLPELKDREEPSAILNAHFVCDTKTKLPGHAPFVGILGGTAEWVFRRGDVLSVTVSAANRYLGRIDDDLALAIWRDVARVLGQDKAPLPPHRLILEKRATALQTPAWDRARPSFRTRYRNLFLAGDWTATGVPATLEGAVRSGFRAAEAALPPA